MTFIKFIQHFLDPLHVIVLQLRYASHLFSPAQVAKCKQLILLLFIKTLPFLRFAGHFCSAFFF
jgi:hypothetical protein